MFVTKKAMAQQVEYLESRLKEQNEKHWSLLRKHEMLLDHLGLVERVDHKVGLVKKGKIK